MATTPMRLNRSIVGLPLGFTQVTDPNYRVFAKTFIQNANIINIIPGRPGFNDGTIRDAKYKALMELIRNEPNGDMDGLWKTGSFGNDGQPVPKMNVDYYKDEDSGKIDKEYEERDVRFYSFDVDFSEYRRIINVLLNEIGAKLAGFSLGHNIEAFLDTTNWHNDGLHFFCEAATTVSESASNEVSESSLAQSTKEIQAKAREVAFSRGFAFRRSTGELEQGGSNFGASAVAMAQRAQSAMGAAAAASQDIGAVITGLNATMKDAASKGEQIIYPKMWKSSQFEKSYNLSFKFETPYGDPQSIFEFVYLPFLMLLTFALPRQVKPDSFKAPMLVRLDSPGLMSCDMGMFTSFSFVRGGASNSWAANGLPRVIDVTATVTDMYPSMAVATNQALLRQNIGLSTFLDNMCGLNVMEAHIADSLRATIMGKVSLFTGAADSAVTSAKDVVEHIADRIF